MNAVGLSPTLLQPGALPKAMSVIEASVHRPKRGTRWVASFRDETGQQRWKATGQTDPQAALVIAQELEREARQRRATQVVPISPSSGKRNTGQLTQKEISLQLGISERAVRGILKRVLRKLARHPELRDIWREWTGNVEEGVVPTGRACHLSEPEIASIYDLARTPAELNLLRRLIATLSSAN